MSVLDLIGRTPLVSLVRLGAGLPVPLLAKCEHLNPGGSVKDRTALAIVDDAEARGVLAPGATLIEATAGNTGQGLALVAAVRGYRLVCVMPEKMSEDKKETLRALGAEVIVTPNVPPGDPNNFQTVARRLAEERGAFLTDQFENPANPRVHEATTGPEILEAAGTVGAFVAGAGTGGTITGVGRFLKQRLPGVRIVLADPMGSGYAGWVRDRALATPAEAPCGRATQHALLLPSGKYLVEGIGGAAVPGNLDASVIDEAIEVSDEESFATARRLVREEGLLVGGSAGTAVAAALRLAARGEVKGPIVALLPDAWDRYRSQPWMKAWSQPP